jgi:DNA (cytosine-5)-methyltransferase 1
MSRPFRILDLFCGAGLVADGLQAAGFDTVGVDLHAQPRYPGPFIQQDALTLDDRFLDDFRFIWASPPCLEATELNASARREQAAHGASLTNHDDLIPATRDMLQRWAARTGGRYVIENVRRAKLLNPIILNGFMFKLGAEVGGVRYHLQRDRKFETNWPLSPLPFERKAPVIGVYGGHARCRSAKAGGRVSGDFPGVTDKTALMREAMGVTRLLTGAEVSQGIPPVYAAYVGALMIHDAMMERAAA